MHVDMLSLLNRCTCGVENCTLLTMITSKRAFTHAGTIVAVCCESMEVLDYQHDFSQTSTCDGIGASCELAMMVSFNDIHTLCCLVITPHTHAQSGVKQLVLSVCSSVCHNFLNLKYHSNGQFNTSYSRH